MFGELEPGADPVRPAHVLGGGGVEGGEDQPSDGIGGQAAVVDQFAEGPIGADHLVLPVGRDQITQSIRIGTKGAHRAGGSGDQGMYAGLLGVGQGRFGLGGQPIQGLLAIAAVVVPDVVDQPGEAVDRQ